MRPHFIIAMFGTLFYFLAASFWVNEAVAQQNTTVKMDPREGSVSLLHFKVFEAAAGDLSLCEGDQDCLRNAQAIQSWKCAANICDGKDPGKEAITCFSGLFQDYSIQEKEQISSLICPSFKSPGPETRRALLAHVRNANEDDLVETIAYALAVNGPAASCVNYIKDYVGPYGPNWKYTWYRALSGCRILAHESTRDQEENNFRTWFGVESRMNKCSDIINGEMRNACSAPSAASPSPS